MTAGVLRCIAALLCVLPALASGGDAVTRYEYDGDGKRTAMIRPGGERWQYGYDAANRLQTVTSPEGAVTTYAYNRADHLIQTTDAEGRTTHTAVDALGRITRRTYANGDVETFDSYDASNNLTLRHDGNGQAIESTFDALERLTRRTYGGPAEPTDIVEESWVYDADGAWTLGTQRAQDGTVYTTRRTYDRQSRLDDETDRYDQLTDHVYDAQDNRVGRFDPEGHAVFQPDRLNRLRTVQPDGESPIAIDYSAAGRIKTHTYPNGATASHDYDSAGRVKTIAHRQHGVVTATFTYTYDINGNRRTETHVAPLGTRITTYVYDRDDRLTETHLTDEANVVTDTVYTLDKVGNRKTEVVSQGATQVANITYTYNPRHQLRHEHDSVSDRRTTRLYDGNGFMTSETTNGQTTTYRPNLQDRLATLTTPTGPPIHYAYNLDGLRVEKRSTAEATRYGYDGTNLRRETNVANNPIATYDWAGGRVLRTKRSNQTSYAQHDALKSPIRWSRADGGELARATYSPWGELSASTGVLPPIGFTGYYTDAESQNYYAQQRYYAPKVGRFMRIDPWSGDQLNPVTLNKYLYAFGNPLIYIDPDGRCPAPCSALRFLYAPDDHQRSLALQAIAPDTATVAGAIYGAVPLTEIPTPEAIAAAVEHLAGNVYEYGPYDYSRIALADRFVEIDHARNEGDFFTSASGTSSLAVDGASAFAVGYGTARLGVSLARNTDRVIRQAPEIGARDIDLDLQSPIGQAHRRVDEQSSPVIVVEGATSEPSTRMPAWLRERFKEGDDFNRRQAAKYPYNEVYVEPRCVGGACLRLDSYNPTGGGGTGEIVSRKHTQLAEIQSQTATNYLRELEQKYAPGTVIADVPSNRASGLAGQKLRGQMFLEVPAQNVPVPQSIIDEATERRIIIRDEFGNDY